MKNTNQLLFVLASVLVVMMLLNSIQGPGTASERIAFSDFLNQVQSGQVEEVVIANQEVRGTNYDGSTFQAFVPPGTDLVAPLTENGVRIVAEPQSGPGILGLIISSLLPIALLIGAWLFIMRRMQGGGPGGVMSFGKSKARLMQPDERSVSFKDVAGIDEAKHELEEVVDFLKDPQKFTTVGGQIPKGVLLVGPPGTGKTLLARAIAGEAGVPFFNISGSDFVEMFVGVGASRVRDMFEQARKNAPCIVFIDEIDAVGRSRGAGLGGGHDEREQTLNQLLVEMDGFEATQGIILVAATNRPDVLDPALLRPGRFDRQVVVPNPDVVGREQILKVHMRKVQLAPDVDARIIARGTPGFSGADLANLVNEAALLAARRGRRVVAMDDFEAAKDKVMMGAERRSMVMTEDEKRLTAYHEAGHALVGLLVPGNDPLHKVTIIPRGRALGVTMNLPERDRYSMSKAEIEARLAMMFGGRLAEEIIFGPDNVTTGASNDIQQATDLARRMVTEWGMSDSLGRLRYSENEEQIFLGRQVARTQNVSEETARLIDSETRRIVEDAEERARQALLDNQDAMHAVADALLEYETLSGEEVKTLLDGETLGSKNRPKGGQDGNIPTRPSAIPLGGRKGSRPGPAIGPLQPQPGS